MEKTMSVDERIRRAEEIYSRRNGGYTRSSEIKKTSRKERLQTIKKLFMQIFVCLLIYVGFYTFTNKDYIFSEEFRNNVKQKVESINLQQFYSNVKGYVETKLLTNNGENVDNEEEKIEQNEQSSEEINSVEQENQNVEENNTNTENNDQSISEEQKNNDQNIGGAESENTEQISNNDENKSEENQELSQMEKDAQDIKSKINFIVPVEGYISSTFGWRTPTTSTVPKYHTGLDIAATTGTIIKSATDGKVILASSEGDFGNHYQIQFEDIVIIYAHCSKLYLKEGDIVTQGQEIAEVGSTGNSTGPHLHFEIRKEDRLVDPQLILDI